jgi:hypothetical protein
MKKYIGTKQIEAEPMTMGEAYRRGLLHAGRVPSESEKSKAGYYVRYENGYESWSPADVFEKAYRVSDTFIDRLRIERDDLSLRYNKALDFSYSPKFKELLWPDEQQAFETQLDLMRKYLAVLDARIQYAENKPNTCNA